MSKNTNFLKKFISILINNKKNNFKVIKDKNIITVDLCGVSVSRKYNEKLKNSLSCNIGLCKTAIINKIIKQQKDVSIKLKDKNNTVTLTLEIKGKTPFKISTTRKYNPALKKSKAYNIGMCESFIISQIIELCFINIYSTENEKNLFIINTTNIIFNKIISPELISSSAYYGLNNILNNNIFNENQKNKIINIITLISNNINKIEDVFISSAFKKYLSLEAKIFKQRRKEETKSRKNKKDIA